MYLRLEKLFCISAVHTIIKAFGAETRTIRNGKQASLGKIKGTKARPDPDSIFKHIVLDIEPAALSSGCTADCHDDARHLQNIIIFLSITKILILGRFCHKNIQEEREHFFSA